MKTMKTLKTTLTTLCTLMSLAPLALPTPVQAQGFGDPMHYHMHMGRILVLNHTHRFVRIFANHAYMGTVAPYSQMWCRAFEGRYFMRAVAFTFHGSVYRWEPYRLYVEPGAVSTWNLME